MLFMLFSYSFPSSITYFLMYVAVVISVPQPHIVRLEFEVDCCLEVQPEVVAVFEVRAGVEEEIGDIP